MTKKKTVYIETTIPSFYYEIRNAPEIIAQRNATRRWWNVERGRYQLLTSAAVLRELLDGAHPYQKEKLALVSALKAFPITHDVARIADVYIKRKLMPQELYGDAVHLATASLESCNFLLTWNCKHLANANKFEHIHHVNTMLGLYVPTITTPAGLISEEGNDEEV